MRRFLRKEIIGRIVFTADGSELGVLDDIVIEGTTGEIRYLLIKTGGKTVGTHDIDKRGRMIYPVSDIKITESALIIG